MPILNMESGITQFYELLNKSKYTTIAIKDEEFLKTILNDETLEMLKTTYKLYQEKYDSNIESIENFFMYYIAHEVKKLCHPPMIELIFDNIELPELYRAELASLHETVPFKLSLVTGRYSFPDPMKEPKIVKGSMYYNFAIFKQPLHFDRFMTVMPGLDEVILANPNDIFNDIGDSIELRNLVTEPLDNFFSPNNN